MFCHSCTGDTLTPQLEDEDPIVPPDTVGLISLPSSLFREINGDPEIDIGLFFTYYDSPTFFPTVGFRGNTRVGTPVIGAAVTLVEQSFSALVDPVTFLLELNQIDQEVVRLCFRDFTSYLVTFSPCYIYDNVYVLMDLNGVLSKLYYTQVDLKFSTLLVIRN